MKRVLGVLLVIGVLLFSITASAVEECSTLKFKDGEEKALAKFAAPGDETLTVVADKKDAESVSLKATGLKVSETIPGKGNARVVVVMDVSGSMDWRSGINSQWVAGTERGCTDAELFSDSTKRLSIAKCVSKDFVDSVMEVEGNELGVVKYSYSASKFDITADVLALKNHISSFNAYGGTCICCGINSAVEMLEAAPTDTQKSIMLFSDGVPTERCRNANEDLDGNGNVDAFDDSIQSGKDAAAKGIAVYTIGFGRAADEATMQKIAEASGGKYYYADVKNVAEIFKKVQDEVSESYPSDVKLDVAADGTEEWSFAEVLKEEKAVAELEEAFNDALSTCTAEPCEINFNIGSSTKGNIEIKEVKACYEVDPCEGVSCGANEKCVDGKCVYVDPCENVECEANQECIEGECKDIDPCADVTCASDEECKEGKCIRIDKCKDVKCPEDEKCIEGECIPRDPCRDVECKEGYACLEGKCLKIRKDPKGGISHDIGEATPPSVQIKRTNLGIAGQKSAEVIFDVVNMDMSHRMDGFILCRSPDNAVVSSSLGAGSGTGAQYISPRFQMEVGPSQRALSITVDSDTVGDVRTGCLIKYMPYLEEDGAKNFLKMSGIYTTTPTDSDYRILRLDKTVSFVKKTSEIPDEQVEWEKENRGVKIEAPGFALLATLMGLGLALVFKRKQ